MNAYQPVESLRQDLAEKGVDELVALQLAATA